MATIKKIDIVIGKVYNNGVLCENPIVEYSGKRGIALPCKDEVNGIYTVELIEGQEEACLTFIVRCEDCGDCPPVVKEICLCTTIDDCPDCHICVDGVCVSTCETGQICDDGVCSDCTDEIPCPCNQVCIQGKCTCPPGTTLNPLTGCCDACSTDEDCPACYICENGTCIPKECADGVCNPEDDTCVECLISSDCDGSNECCVGNECVCCLGYVRVGGICIPAPECDTDADCSTVDPCLTCQYGNCVPTQCPPGQVPTNIGGICECREECDCDIGVCSDKAEYCDATGYDNCACLPCEGDCTSGCVYPCYCSPTLNKCVNNPCVDVSCVNGVDCADGCGCQNGECVPCDLLSCATTECADTLGCECQGNTCVDSDGKCSGDCATAFDCGEGCTCYEGKCVSCDNFECNPNNCDQYEGCACVGGDCVGAEKTCNDILTITKDDSTCSFTGSLTKDDCCSCSPLTLDIKGRRGGEDTETYSMVFIAELRKGSYDGINVDNKPRVDDFANEIIADNEPPTSGVVSYSSITTWANYALNSVTGVYEFTGTSAGTAVTGTAAFNGGTGGVEFAAVNLPKIGVRVQVDSTNQREAVSVEVKFSHTSTFQVDNQCSYASGTIIGEYQIADNSQYTAFTTEVSAYNNPIGTTITSDACRDPFFRWFKDGVVVRKSYISGGPVYTDVITRPPYEWLESCHNYVLEVDCSCSEDASQFITFCNPESIAGKFDLLDCNRTFVLNEFETCEPNEDKEFFIRGGSLDIRFLGSNPPIGENYQSTECISQIEYGLSCSDDCTQTYESPCPEFTLEFDPVCAVDALTFTIVVPATINDQAGNPYQVQKIEIAGLTLLPGTSGPIPIGTYTGTVYLIGGCDPFTVTIQEDCCGSQISNISRSCEGVVTCTQDDEVMYTLDGVLKTDICAAVSALDLNVGAEVIARKNDCIPAVFDLRPIGDFCCDNFAIDLVRLSDVEYRLDILGSPTVLTASDITITGPTVVAISGASCVSGVVLGTNQFCLTNFTLGESYNILVADETCGLIDTDWVPGECDLNLVFTETDCELKGEIDPQSCECRVGRWLLEVTNVVDLGANYRVYYEYSLDNFDANPVSGEMFYTINEVKTSLGNVSLAGSNGSFLFAKPADVLETCLSTSIEIELLNDSTTPGPCYLGSDCNSVELELFVDGVNIVDGAWGDYSVTVYENPATAQTITKADHLVNPDKLSDVGLFTFAGVAQGPLDGFAQPPIPITVEVSITDPDSNVFTSSVIVMMEILSPLSVVIPDMCTDVTVQASDIQVRFSLEDLMLEDDCTYADAGQNFNIIGDANWTPTGVQEIQLLAVDINERDVKFTWFRDGVIVYTEWEETESILPEAYLVVGSTYSLVADCPPCSDVETLLYCCIPVLTFEIPVGPPCNPSVNITVTGYPGNYEVDILGNTYPITLVGPGITSGVVTYPNPLPASTTITATVSVPSTTCTEDYTFDTNEYFVPAYTINACSGGLYSISMTNCVAGCTTTIHAGSGNVAANGYDIENIDENDRPFYSTTDLAGCESAILQVDPPPTTCISSSSGTPGSSSQDPSSSNPDPSSSVATSSLAVVSSSRAASSSQVEASSSGPASSGIPASSSNAEASSSNVPHSSSNIGASSSVAGSSGADASSSIPDASSSNATSSSNLPDSSSNATSSSNIPNSSSRAASSSNITNSSSGAASSSQPNSSSPGGDPSSSQPVIILGACCIPGSGCVNGRTAFQCGGGTWYPGLTCGLVNCNSSSEAAAPPSSSVPAAAASSSNTPPASSSGILMSTCTFEGQACGDCGTCVNQAGPGDPEDLRCRPTESCPGGECCVCNGILYCDCVACTSSSIPGA